MPMKALLLSSSTGWGVVGIPITGAGVAGTTGAGVSGTTGAGVAATIGAGVSGTISTGLAAGLPTGATGITVVNSGVGGNVGSGVAAVGAAVGLDTTENVVTCVVVKASYDWRRSEPSNEILYDPSKPPPLRIPNCECVRRRIQTTLHV